MKTVIILVALSVALTGCDCMETPDDTDAGFDTDTDTNTDTVTDTPPDAGSDADAGSDTDTWCPWLCLEHVEWCSVVDTGILHIDIPCEAGGYCCEWPPTDTDADTVTP